MKFAFAVLLLLSGFSLADAPKEVQQGFEVRGHYGLVPHPKEIPAKMPHKGINLAYPGKFDLGSLVELPPIKNQASCGSCVYFATTYAMELAYRLRGETLPKLAPQHIMDCLNREWMCNGSFFSKVAGGVVKKGSVAQESDYPYKASNQSCKGDPAQLFGKFTGYKIIENDAKSIIAQLHELNPVPTTIGAGGGWPGNGKVTSCQSIGTNHQVVIIGYDCETAVDAAGDCKFDAQGNLPKGVGTWRIANSWGTGSGDKGFVTMKMTDGSGRKCYNVTEEAGIIEVGIDPNPPSPVSFTVQSRSGKNKLNATWKPGAPYSVEQAKQKLQNAVNSVEAK